MARSSSLSVKEANSVLTPVAPLIELAGITKQFHTIQALRGVDLSLSRPYPLRKAVLFSPLASENLTLL